MALGEDSIEQDDITSDSIYVKSLLDAGWKWDAQRSSTVINWAVDATWTPAQLQTIATAFATWAAVADVTFHQVTDPADAEIVLHQTVRADINGFSGYSGTPAEATATASFGNEIIAEYGQVHTYLATDGWLISGQPSTFVTKADSSVVISAEGFEMLLHEIGHALGLKHPHNAVQGDRIRSQPTSTDVFPGVTFQSPLDTGDNDLNQSIYTLMSYAHWGEFDISPGAILPTMATPMALDLAAIQRLYGANTTIRSGNDTYFLPEPGSSSIIQAIWDTGGLDEIVYSGAASAFIDLRPATLDDSITGGGMLSYTYTANAGFDGIIGYGFTIAGDYTNALVDVQGETGVIIENAKGGAADDTIIGNQAANTIWGGAGNDALQGGGGNDLLEGGTGIDTARFSGARANYSISFSADFVRIADNRSGNDGVDTIRGVENFKFSDGTLSVLEANGSTLLIPFLTNLGSSVYLSDAAGVGPSLKRDGIEYTVGAYGDWAAIGAERSGSGYQVVWKVTGADQYTVWSTDSQGNYTSNIIGVVSGSNAFLQALESSFAQDLNGNGQIGLAPRVVEANGATHLTELGGSVYLYDSAGAGPSLKRDGIEYTVGAYGDWAAIGAERSGSGYQVVWKVTGADQYTVWSTDSQGNYTSNIIGVVSGSNAFLQALESSFAQDLNGNGQIGLAPRVVEANGATRLTEMGGPVYLYDSAGAGPSLKRDGIEYTVGAYGDWAAIGAERTAGGYQVVWKVTGADQYTVWSTDSQGNYLANIIGVVSGSNAFLQALESSFAQDLNGNGQIGLAPRVVEANGATHLTELGGPVYLYDSAGAGPSLKRDGIEYTVGAYGDWAAIGAERSGSGYQVVWKVTGADQYTVWSTDSQGNYLANIIGVVSGSNAFLQALESSFAQDLNGNGQIGLAPRVVEANGATHLTELGGSVYLYDSAGAGPSLKRDGIEYTVGAYGDWAAIGAERSGSGYQVVWKVTGADQYTVWSTDSQGNYTSNIIGVVSGSNAFLQALESSFAQDLNGNGQIGLAPRVVEANGATHLTELGGSVYLYDSAGAGPSLKRDGIEYTVGAYGDWAAIGAERSGSGYQVVWKVTGADQYTVWSTDSQGNYTSNIIGVVSGSNAFLQALESSFAQDLNGNGQIGTGANASLNIAAAEPDTFVFHNDYLLSTPQTIHDFDSGIDKIDLRQIDANVNLAGDQAFFYTEENAFRGPAGELIFVSGALLGDLDGDGTADFQVILTGVSSLAREDFLL